MAVVPNEESSSIERILSEATRLFAEAGYEGVSTRQIGTATGLNISTINHHVGSKRQLYLRVIESLYEKEEQLVNEIVDAIDDSIIADKERFYAALANLIDRLLGFAHDNPDRQRLYVQRWLEPADELKDREVELTLRLYRRLAKILKRGQEHGVVRDSLDLGYFLRSFDFMMFSYFTSGAFNWRLLRADPHQKTNLDKFKNYLLDYTRHMLEN